MRLNRALLLRKMGLEYDLPFTGDISCARPLNIDASSAAKVHQVHAPFVNFGATFERCSGSTLVRVDRTTVAVPCFCTDITTGGSVCKHCFELWNSGPNDDGFFVLDKQSMKHAAEYYKPGAGNSFFRLPALREAADLYSSEISVIKQIFDGTTLELEAEWPGCHFKKVVESALVDVGVVFTDSGKKTSPYKRLAVEQQRLGEYMKRIVKLWLRIRTFMSLEDLLEQTRILGETARSIEKGMISILQARLPKQPVYCGALSVADVMLSGFTHAAGVFDQVVAVAVDENSASADIPEFWWGPRVEEMRTWASTVQHPTRPPKRRIPTKAAPPAAKATQRTSPFNATGVQYFAVAVGRVPGVYMSMAEVREQTQGLPDAGPDKGKMKIFATQADAEQYVQRYGRAVSDAKPETKPASRRLFVAVGGSRPGIYEHKLVAEFYARKGDGTVKEIASFAEGRRVLNKPAPPYFRESTVPSDNVIDLSAAAKPNNNGKFFAVIGGAKPGVYCSESEAFDTVTNHGGTFTPYMTEAEATRAFEAVEEQKREVTGEEPPLPRMAFVVWAGRSVGVMSREACVRATVGLSGVRMKGPMSAQDAFGIWLEKERIAVVLKDPNKKPKLEPAPRQADPPCNSGGLPRVDTPDNDKLERAEALGVTRVFACRVNASHVRIALSYEGAKAGVSNAEVTSFFQKQTLVENLADAELWATYKSRKTEERPFAERYTEARQKVFVEHSKKQFDVLGNPKPGYDVTGTPIPKKRSAEESGSGPTPGQSQLGGGYLGFKGMVRSRRVRQMQRCFVDCSVPIRVDEKGMPQPDQLDEDNMELPGSATYMLSPSRSDGPLKIEEWLEERKNSIKAWPLMGFSEFLSFCRHAIKLCSRSTKPAAVVTCAALNELTDRAILLHRHMSLLKTLGPADIRFKARMYLHLQLATTNRVVYTSASAMSVFKEATEVFMARLPRSLFVPEQPTSPTRAKQAHDKYAPSPAKPTLKNEYGMPRSGCYLCAATDHYCSNRTFHPLDSNNKHKKVPQNVQQAIMARIDNSPSSTEWKAAEKKRVRDFWSRRCAP